MLYGQLKKILSSCLLAFALISIGFVMGKHSVKPLGQANSLSKRNNHQITVYYLHSTFRCVACNTIEKMTQELLTNYYSNELAEGKIQWIEDDFQENDTLAKQFEVIASCVVVAEIKDGSIVDYKRLDEVWTLVSNPKSFNRYISDAIDGYLQKNRGN